MRTEHILIIRFSTLADVVMTVPVVYSLARRYPDVRITMLSREAARPFFELMPHNVSFMSVDLEEEYQGVRGLNALYRRLVAKNFTAIADMHSVLRSDYLRMRFNLGGFKVAHIDKHRAGRRLLTAASGKVLEQQPTAYQKYADVLARIGYPVKVEFKSVFADREPDLTLLPPGIGARKKAGEKWIGIAPFAPYKSKTYPPRLMEKVIMMLRQKHSGCRIFLFGRGEQENAQIDDWCARISGCVNAHDAMDGMREELVLTSRLDLMISMDNACLHIASITGTPCVSVWGATHPFAGFTGWGQRQDTIVQLDLPCRPCTTTGKQECLRGDCSCLKNISPEQIVERAEIVMLRGRI